MGISMEWPLEIIELIDDSLIHMTVQIRCGVLVWLGSCMVRPSPRCSGINKHVNLSLKVSACFLQGSARCPNCQTQVRSLGLGS